MSETPYSNETLSEYIDDFMTDNDNVTSHETSLVLQSKMADDKSKTVDDENIEKMVDNESNKNNDISNMADEEIVHVEAIHEVEATPFFPDVSPVPLSSPEGKI